MALLLLGLVRAFGQYPRPCPTTGSLTGLGFGLAIGSRVMGGFGILSALAAFALVVTVEARADGLRAAGRRLGQFVLAMLPYLILAIAVMALVWPWAVADPLNPFRALAYFSHFFEEPWNELFGGKLILVPDMPRRYVPMLLALQLPAIFSLLALGGTVGALLVASRRAAAPNRSAVLLLVAVAALLPIVVTILARPAMYNGIRHFVFVLPPLAVLAGLAGTWIAGILRRRGRLATIAGMLVFAAGVGVPVADMVRLHPYEYTYFNRLAGGVAGAHGRYMLDYWGLSFKQASQGLAAKLAELKLTRPEGRRWRLAVCGPHRSPQVELGPDFETTWDSQGADFALMLGEFYCAIFDAPVLVEVTRDGVVYARVYDVRGRSYRSLLAMPDD